MYENINYLTLEEIKDLKDSIIGYVEMLERDQRSEDEEFDDLAVESSIEREREQRYGGN